MPLVISLRPRTVALVLALIAVYLAAQSLAARHIVEATAGPPGLLTNLIQVLNVNRESSLPAWYSSGLLLLAAALLAVNAALHRQERYARHWAGLAAIFLYLSADEAAAIHEEFTDPLQTALNTSGYLSFAWVIVGAAFVLVVGLLYARFVLHLPPATRRGMIAAAVLYVGGALVIESISANQWELDGGSSLLYSAIGTLEELCEMLGVIVLIYTLLAYLEQRQVAVQFDFTGAARTVPPTASRRRVLLPLLIAFGSGVSFSMAQWVLARETGAFLGAELAGLLVIAAAVIGLASGHFLAGRLQRAALLPVALALHLTLPVWLRLLAAGFIPAAGLPAVSLLVALVTAAFYGALAAATGDARHTTAQYGVLLAGAVVGCQIVVLLAGVGITALLLVHSAVLLGLLLALRRRVEAGLLALAAGAWLMVFPAVNDWSNARWYQQVAGLPAGTITRYSAYSLYQKVDVLETPDGRRALYLDGLNTFDTVNDQQLSRVLADLPGQMTRPQTALVIGASSISLEAALAQAAGQVTLDERDALALDARARYFPTRLTRTPATEPVDLTAARYDLIISAIPPVDYSEAFMVQAIKTRLTPGGLWVIRLAGAVEPDNHIARRVTAGLLLHFDDVVILTSPAAGWSVIYAGDPLPFGRRELEAALRQPSFTIFDTAAVRAFTGDAQPITSELFDRLLLQLDWLPARWFQPQP